MVKKIIHVKDEDSSILTKPAENVTYDEGMRIARDLIDTAKSNNENNQKTCCGLAANQIGEAKKVFIVQFPNDPHRWEIIINPKVAGKSTGVHMSTEGCMSTDTETTVKRHDSITLVYQNEKNGKKFIKRTFIGFMAVEVQHELDHLRGILI